MLSVQVLDHCRSVLQYSLQCIHCTILSSSQDIKCTLFLPFTPTRELCVPTSPVCQSIRNLTTLHLYICFSNNTLELINRLQNVDKNLLIRIKHILQPNDLSSSSNRFSLITSSHPSPHPTSEQAPRAQCPLTDVYYGVMQIGLG